MHVVKLISTSVPTTWMAVKTGRQSLVMIAPLLTKEEVETTLPLSALMTPLLTTGPVKVSTPPLATITPELFTAEEKVADAAVNVALAATFTWLAATVNEPTSDTAPFKNATVPAVTNLRSLPPPNAPYSNVRVPLELVINVAAPSVNAP